MSTLQFNVSAFTARLIGRENVSKLDGAILELVKNTYDADATVCAIYYEESTNSVFILDNGHGMSDSVIKEHWMTIGNSSKVTKFTSLKGRTQTGAKGIGRFALDRISDSCTMYTKTLTEGLEWHVDWTDFTQGKKITDIFATLDKADYDIKNFLKNVKNRFFADFGEMFFKESGTVFKLSQLRDEWSRSLVSDLRKSLATLVPPEMSNLFAIYFFTESTTADEAKISIDDGVFSFDYKIHFKMDLDGGMTTSILRNEFSFTESDSEYLLAAGFSKDDIEHFLGKPIVIQTSFQEILDIADPAVVNQIGAFSGTLYFAKLSASKNEQDRYFYKDFSDRRPFQSTFGGIKIYRDNFRVRPYGEPKTSNYDWLLLSHRKSQSPAGISHPTGAWRVNSDQMLGSIHISRANLLLPDQSNREGIVETHAFMQLKEIINKVIREFERDRQNVFRLLNAHYENTHMSEIYEKEINDKADHEEQSKKNAPANEVTPEVIEVSKVKTVIESKDDRIRFLEDENRLLRTLATTGIVTNSYIHEIKTLTNTLSLKLSMAKEVLTFGESVEDAMGYLSEAIHIKDHFNSWFKITIDSVRRDKRTMQKVRIKELVERQVESWNTAMVTKKITITSSVDDIYFRCFPYEIETILNNLIANSISVLDDPVILEKGILITVKSKEHGLEILYSDTGPGLSSTYKSKPERILEPFESGKRNEQGELVGTGMGMWIVAKTIAEYGGNVDLSANKNNTRGFHVRLTLGTKL